MDELDAEFQQLLHEYSEQFDLTTLNSANDKVALEQLIRNQVLIRRWQRELARVTDPIELQKRTQAITTLIRSCQDIERQLKIDRKTRVGDGDMSVAQYIAALQEHAKTFLEQRLQRMYCPRCNVLVFRYAPAHDHTAFTITATCSVCNKQVTVQRSAKGTLDDLPRTDRTWRYRHPVAVTTAASGTAITDIPPVLTISDGADGNSSDGGVGVSNGTATEIE